jgi:peptidoglycan/LPS O-acetylase OafA/YrhL
MRLKSLDVLKSDARNPSIDVFRGLAILGVVIGHYGYLPYGGLGVDLFFVISGLLVSGLLTKKFQKAEKINFFSFFIQRGFKIWPSYYVYLFVGNFLAYFIYSDFRPDQIIETWDLKRYIFFYQNYTGAPYHYSFDQVWSLCVEEHFYILLPIGMILLQKFKANHKALITSVCFVIFAGIVFKLLAFYFTESKDTYSSTHSRIDALGWGVLLNLIITYYPEILERVKKPYLFSVVGMIIFGFALYIELHTNLLIYHKVWFKAVIPFSFFLMVAGVYNFKLNGLKWLRFIAYYSYNWYLWQQLFILAIFHYNGNNYIAFGVVGVIGSFLIAMLFTILVEEPFLELRKKLFNKQRDKLVPGVSPVLIMSNNTKA